MTYLGSTSDNNVWRIGVVRNWAEMLLHSWGPSESWNAEESAWSWEIMWCPTFSFLNGSRFSLPPSEIQSFLLGRCPRLHQCPLKISSEQCLWVKLASAHHQSHTSHRAGLPAMLRLLAFGGHMSTFYMWDGGYWWDKLQWISCY